jgi:hypothetical protein
MATMRDLDELALALPETTKEIDDEGRVSYLVHGTWFVFHRRPRPDAVDARGERLEDVLAFRTPDLDVKDLLLSDDRGAFFTTPHWNGYSAVLVRIPNLRKLRKSDVRDLVEDAWLTRAQKRVAKAWLAEQGVPE